MRKNKSFLLKKDKGISEAVVACILLLAGCVIAVFYFMGSSDVLTLFNSGIANQTTQYIQTLQ